MILTKKNLTNSLLLSAVQGINYLVPLITFPILIKFLGVEEFGKYSFVLAMTAFLSFIIDGGFSIYGSKKISTILNTTLKIKINVSYLFYSIFLCKFFTFIAISIVYIALTSVIEKLNSNYNLMLPSIIFFFSFLFNVDWYYQGIQKTFPLLIASFISKSIFISLILSADTLDSYYAMMLLSTTLLCSNLLLFFKTGINISNNKLRLLKYSKLLYLESKRYLTSKISIELYRGAPPVILGMMLNTTSVSYYVIVDKIITAIQSLQIPIGKALLPSAIQQINDLGKQVYLARVVHIYQFLMVVYVIIMLGIFFASPLLVQFFLGMSNEDVESYIKIFSLIIFLGGSNYFIGVIGLIPLEQDLFFTRVLNVVGLLSILTLCVSIYFFGIKGAIWSVVFSEFMIFVLFLKRFVGIRKLNDNL